MRLFLREKRPLTGDGRPEFGRSADTRGTCQDRAFVSLIFGIVARGASPVPIEWLARARAEADNWPADEVQAEASDSAVFLCRQRCTTPWMRNSAPIASDGKVSVLFDGRLDNRAELASRLGLRSPECLSDGELALQAWHCFADRMPDYLTGDFAIAVYDHPAGALTLVRDRVGIRPLFVAETDDFVTFCSAMPPLLALPISDWSVDTQWVVDFLEEIKPDSEYTPYRQIRAVAPARMLRFEKGDTRRSRYWSLSVNDEPSDLGHGEIVRRTRELLDEAVACRLVSGGGRVAAELSGGLDSSSIAVIAADRLEAFGQRLIGVTQAAANDFQERYGTLLETRYADAVYAFRPGIERLDVVNRTESLLGRLSETLARHGAPPRNDFNAFATEAPDLLARHDARILLSGFGGDQLVTTRSGSLSESLVADGNWRELIALCFRSGARKRTARAVLAGLPGIGRHIPRMPEMTRQSPHLASYKARRASGYPERAGQHPMPPTHGTLRQRDRIFFERPVMSYRLQDSQVGAGARGIEYRYPLLDVRLIEFVHSLPTLSRITRSDARRLIRDVMAGRLPELVHQRRDKTGMTVPGVFVNVVRHAGELRTHIARMATDPQLGKLACYDEVIRDLDRAQATGEFPKQSAIKAYGPNYRGVNEGQVLRLAMLGLWLDKRRRDAQRIAGEL